MDDSSFCQQKPYPCTAEYYTLFDTKFRVGGARPGHAHYCEVRLIKNPQKVGGAEAPLCLHPCCLIKVNHTMLDRFS